MNKKPLVLSVILLVIPILNVVLVQAGKGQEKLYYEANLVIPGYTVDEARTVPPGGIPPNTVFLNLHATAIAFTLQIGSEVYTPTHSAEMKVIINTHQNIVHLEVWETYTFDGIDGKIEIWAIGKIYNYGNLATQMSDTKIVGHGTGYFESIEISAEGWNELGNFAHKIHVGTIMGWPSLST